MALELENINNLITDDLDLRNRNWGAIDTALTGKADKTYVDSKVQTDVPSGAKFTDTNTTYSEITTAEIDAGTSGTLRTITGRRVKYVLDKIQGWINALTKSDVGLGNVDNVKQMPVSGGTFTGISKAQGNTSYTVAQIRNVKFKQGTNDFTTSELANGEIGFLYE